MAYKAPVLPSNAVRAYHLSAALGMCECATFRQVKEGKLPIPDGKSGNIIFWRIESIRRANPRLADRVQRVINALADSQKQAA